MGDSKKEIRIKSFQTQLFDDLIDKVNIWLSDRQDKTRNSFEFIDLKYYYKDSPSSDNDFQHSAIVIYKDSQDNLSKEKTEESNTTNDEEFIAEKKKLEYRK
ncbi:MAG TPA: hypothetical protein VE307_04770 [Nitrososphaeraceae archaeon]|nr:hypothetical protein [Nitrososphaeraceae archaeon]